MRVPEQTRISDPERIVPSRLNTISFAAKSSLLRIRRAIQNVLLPVPRHVPDENRTLAALIAAVTTPLWTTESLVERSLQLGKVQNLRMAVQKLNGLVIPRGELFSFWRQLGRATRAKGYVTGRELREGCLIPAIGGGLCQLSNALYDAALQSGCEIVERHAHSRIVPGSAASYGRDATVAWNYVDLRFRPQEDIRVKIFLSTKELTVRFWAAEPANTKAVPLSSSAALPILLDPIAHTCTDCGVNACFRHVEPKIQPQPKTAYLLDECWPEFLHYVKKQAAQEDFASVPINFGRYRGARSLNGKIRNIRSVALPALSRALKMRAAQTVPSRVQAQLLGSRAIAESMAVHVPYDAEHVVVAQSFLPFLWRNGMLGGRTFDVLMTRMPLARLHELLDEAALRDPNQTTLREYRAPQWIVDAECEALAQAHRVITPHTGIAKLFNERALQLSWVMPKTPKAQRGRLIIFPGPTVARKGAFELRAAMEGLNCNLMILAGNLEQSNFWQGVHVLQPAHDWLHGAGVIVQPALLEDNPRPLLRAVAADVPVICTRHCGLSSFSNVTTVEFGNVEQLRDAINTALLTTQC